MLRLVDTGANTHRPAYRDKIGRRLLMLSDQPVPMPADADHSNRFPRRRRDPSPGVAVLCSRFPHTVLVVDGA